MWQAQEVGPVAGTLLGRATPAYLPDHVLLWGDTVVCGKNMLEHVLPYWNEHVHSNIPTCWNMLEYWNIKRWSVEI